MEHTNIQLTANDRLFVSQMFDVPANQTSLILLDFGGIHLVEQGNGDFTLSPQLRVDLTVSDAAVHLSGVIEAIDAQAGVLTIALSDDSEMVVHYTAAVVYLPDDIDTATGTTGDLAAGQQVDIVGTISVAGVVSAETIEIAAATEE